MKRKQIGIYDRAVSLCLEYPGYRVLLVYPRTLQGLVNATSSLGSMAFKYAIKLYNEIRIPLLYHLTNGSQIRICGTDGDVFGEHAATEFDMMAFVDAEEIPPRTMEFLLGNIRGRSEFPKEMYYNGYDIRSDIEKAYKKLYGDNYNAESEI